MSANPIFDELAEAAGLVLDSDELDPTGTEPPEVPADQEELVGLPAPRHRR